MRTKILMIMFFVILFLVCDSPAQNNLSLVYAQGQVESPGSPAEVTGASKIQEIKLEAFQFGFSPEKIVVKKGDTVKLSVTSRDVTHGIYIKEYGINVPVKKGEVKTIVFIADKAGEFDIRCSVYCGSGHENMKGKMVVE